MSCLYIQPFNAAVYFWGTILGIYLLVYRRLEQCRKFCFLSRPIHNHCRMFQQHMPRESIRTTSDPATGKMEFLSSTKGIDNPTYAVVDETRQHLYAVTEFEHGETNTCCAFKINRETGELTLINEQPTLGNAACYVTIEATGKYVLVANYMNGKTAAMFPIRVDGGVDAMCNSVQHVGSSVNTERQKGPHGHCTVVDPSNTYVFVADLGIDQLVRYRLDVTNGKLIPRQKAM